jgi:hypothetical protein
MVFEKPGGVMKIWCGCCCKAIEVSFEDELRGMTHCEDCGEDVCFERRMVSGPSLRDALEEGGLSMEDYSDAAEWVWGLDPDFFKAFPQGAAVLCWSDEEVYAHRLIFYAPMGKEAWMVYEVKP